MVNEACQHLQYGKGFYFGNYSIAQTQELLPNQNT